jgi:hypothetical protein
MVATGNDGGGGATAVCGFDEQLYNIRATSARQMVFILIIDLVS